MRSKLKPIPVIDSRPVDHYQLTLPRELVRSLEGPAEVMVLRPKGTFEFMAANDVEAVARAQKYIFARGLPAGSLRLFRSPSIEIPL